MAKLLTAALQCAGHTVELASRLTSYSHAPDLQALAELEARAAAETSRLAAHWRNATRVPDLWLTYHSYYKAPDCLGPAAARALDIPYVTAEASHAGKRNRDGWRAWQRHVEAGLLQGEAHFYFTSVDAAGLASFLGGRERLIELAPFIDPAGFAAEGGAKSAADGGTARFIVAAMMRPGVKLQSYRFLARALRRLCDLDWRLSVIGDGPARPAVLEAFAGFSEARLDWLGEVPRGDVPARLAGADIYAWPGFGEAYGIAYLEAQAAGLPVVALDCGGVGATLVPGETGFLIGEDNLDAYTEALALLIRDPVTRRRMGAAAHRFIRRERSLEQAAAILDRELTAVCRRYREKKTVDAAN